MGKVRERLWLEEEVEYVPLQRGEQVGPGGLDPAEVFETLPKVRGAAHVTSARDPRT